MPSVKQIISNHYKTILTNESNTEKTKLDSYSYQ